MCTITVKTIMDIDTLADTDVDVDTNAETRENVYIHIYLRRHPS